MHLKRVAILFVLFLSLSAFTTTGTHKYYMSVTDIEYAPEKKSLQIISRLFIDDFHKLLQTRYDASAELIRGENKPVINSYIEKYFEEKLHIYIQDQSLSLKFIGKRYEDDLIICYFEAENIENFKNVSVSNQVLFDLYEDQKNLVHFKKDGDTKSLMLLKNKSKSSLTF